MSAGDIASMPSQISAASSANQMNHFLFEGTAAPSRRLNRAFNLLADCLVYPNEEEKANTPATQGLN
jgi:hypothetical protein